MLIAIDHLIIIKVMMMIIMAICNLYIRIMIFVSYTKNTKFEVKKIE